MLWVLDRLKETTADHGGDHSLPDSLSVSLILWSSPQHQLDPIKVT